MISGRMTEIIHYLNDNRISSYKLVSEALGHKDRNVRYDIDCINGELSLLDLPPITKESKGRLVVPEDLDLNILIKDNEFLFSPEEREAILSLYILFNTEALNIRKLSEFFQVSRRSVQKDIDAVMKEMESFGLQLVYDKTFKLNEENTPAYTLRVNELKKYVSLLNKKDTELSPFEAYVIKFVGEIFKDVSVENLYAWINNRINTMSWTFSDNSYDWYVANIFTTCWCIIHKHPLPPLHNEIDTESTSVEEVGTIIGRKLTTRQKQLIASFSTYTNKYVDLDINLDLIMTEDIIYQLVGMMSSELNVKFDEDMILNKGLLNHVAPMLERLKGNVLVYEMDTTVIPDNYLYIFHTLKDCVAKVPFLHNLAEEELIFLSIHFIGSMQRLRQNDYKKVLLVCGLGYGATALLKDTLRNEYQVELLDSIPAYGLDNYGRWADIDIVIATSRIHLPVKKPMVNVNIIFTPEDHSKLEAIGIRKKNVLTNYIAIEKRLDFLPPSARQKALAIIREELGYKDVNIPNKYYNLSDLLGIESIRLAETVEPWQEAVKLVTGILAENGCVDEGFYEDIASGIEESGFYSITDGAFALLHGGNTDSVQVSSMSLLISKEPIVFGSKRVNIVFCLASKDKKEHIPAVVKLMRMVNNTDFLEQMKACNRRTEVIEVIHACEDEVQLSYT